VDAAGIEVLDHSDEMRKRTPQAVELETAPGRPDCPLLAGTIVPRKGFLPLYQGCAFQFPASIYLALLSMLNLRALLAKIPSAARRIRCRRTRARTAEKIPHWLLR
jgi:hypothetical protein